MRQTAYLLILFFVVSCKAQNTAGSKSVVVGEQKTLEQAAAQVIKLYNDKNDKELSKLIYPQIGLYFLYRPGTVDFWKNTNKICFNVECLKELPIPEWGKEALINQKLDPKYKLQQTTEEIVGCESVLKNGLFWEESDNTKSLLSETVGKYIEAFRSELPSLDLARLKVEQEKIELWEKNSKRIVVAQKKDSTSKGEAFVFYLTKIEGSWYLTIIDFVSFDCSV
jgi:hypothetical protein